MMHHIFSILAVLASTALAGDIQARDACSDACSNAYDTCRTKPDANRASCAADYAGCLGYNPFESGSLVAPTACAGGSIMSTMAAPNATRSMTMMTQTVMSYTTYCPSPTSLVVNSKTYTVTQPTTLTITDCPCTITTSMPVSTPGVVPPPAATTKPVQVAGAGNIKPAMALLAGVGAVALL